MLIYNFSFQSGNVRAHSVLSLEEQVKPCLVILAYPLLSYVFIPSQLIDEIYSFQDAIATCAQTLLRCLSHGATNEVLGLVRISLFLSRCSFILCITTQ